jgi:hypothetical protein
MMNIKTANGLRACLIYCGDGQYRVRIYDERGYEFKDYDIKHCDLFFEINDEDAYLYELGDKCWIDHSPQTLGKDNERTDP